MDMCMGMAKLLLLLLLVVTAGHGHAAAAAGKERNTITHVKGFDGPLPFALETGYVEVDEAHGAELFYYFIQSERSPREDPLILWITGGPGCSALSGLLFEIGPLKFDVAGYTEGFPRLVYFEDSWTRVSNVIFLDAPVGTGFSYAREEEGLDVSLTGTGTHLRVFLQRWIADHPEFASNPLYIGGDSYSGDFVTTPRNAQCANALMAITMATFAVNPVHILEPMCGLALRPPTPVSSILSTGTRRRSARLLVQEADRLALPVECRDNGYRLSYAWADDAEVRATLGIREGSVGAWSRCVTLTHFRHDVASTVPYHTNLTRRGYRALVYNGDHDMDMTFVGTQAWIRTLGYPAVAPWRPWYANRQVAGFTTEYAHNLTFATVKGGGHTAPEYRPKECLAMLDRWTSADGRL
ncbi:unnamed protein product [Triticum turgidum subsp. durum]|uniref:Uncharacterized protein n=1 Tax=Triticum turgidum subsp. durum TaxID=4567 RepID=A0A9R0TWU2_TRITD|nr:unnamed protein product [Triticum turgidum subsp. durum]